MPSFFTLKAIFVAGALVFSAESSRLEKTQVSVRSEEKEDPICRWTFGLGSTLECVDPTGNENYKCTTVKDSTSKCKTKEGKNYVGGSDSSCVFLTKQFILARGNMHDFCDQYKEIKSYHPLGQGTYGQLIKAPSCCTTMFEPKHLVPKHLLAALEDPEVLEAVFSEDIGNAHLLEMRRYTYALLRDSTRSMVGDVGSSVFQLSEVLQLLHPEDTVAGEELAAHKAARELKLENSYYHRAKKAAKKGAAQANLKAKGMYTDLKEKYADYKAKAAAKKEEKRRAKAEKQLKTAQEKLDAVNAKKAASDTADTAEPLEEDSD